MSGHARPPEFPPAPRSFFHALFCFAALLTFAGCSSNQSENGNSGNSSQLSRPTRPQNAVAQSPIQPASPSPVQPAQTGVMLGIDVLAAQNFAPIAGKRVGVLTHPAGVNRHGVSTVDVLFKAPNVQLVALFGPEHGIYGNTPASINIADSVDKRTGLPAYSLYGKNRRPTKEQLAGLDALLIDMQDIGVRSYTYSVCMKYAIEACFEHGVEVIVLDRPNPLGGLKVDGPMLDRQFFSGVGQYEMPYVHGLTMGELARMAAGTPGALEISEAVRLRGKLTVIPMQGWRRSMRWPETGLRFVPTSPNIPDFAACVGYAMTGLGCQIGGFSHGIGTQYPFRGVSTKLRSVDQLHKDLVALRLPGLSFKRVSLTSPTGAAMGIGIYVEVSDWDDWNPTELSFHLMRLAAHYNAKNPFAAASADAALLFNKHTGSLEWWNALKRDGARVDVEGFFRKWKREAHAFQQNSRRFWLYN
jgi:Uncharacterized protein conserved in bacteria